MFTLPYLADEQFTDLTPVGLPGVVVWWRPMDLLEKSRWADVIRQKKLDPWSAEGILLGVKQQLLRVEGLSVQIKKEGSDELVEVPFDPKVHFNKLPFYAMYEVWEAMEKRANLSEGERKNSERPSASGDTSGSANSPAEPATNEPVTNIIASFPPLDVSPVPSPTGSA